MAWSRIWQMYAAARKVIDDAGFGDYFIHCIVHDLWLETHDGPPLGDYRN